MPKPAIKPALLALGLACAQPGSAQEPAAAAPVPESSRTTLAPGQGAPAPLARLVTVHLRNVTLGEALNEINRQAGLGLAFTPRVVPVDRIVSLDASNITAGAALERLLRNTGVRAVVLESGAVMLARALEEAQSRTSHAVGAIAGTVTDSMSGKAITRVMVSVKGTEMRAFTDTLGRYVIPGVAEGVQVVTTRMLGYRQEERQVVVQTGEVARVNFSLRYTPSRLQEVIVTASGPRRRLELGNDITVLNADSIVRTQPVRNVTELLENRVPGLVVMRTSGAPGDPSRIRIRGASSAMLSNDPIIIIDGVRTYSDQSSARSGNLAGCAQGTCRADNYAAPSPLDLMDPNTIETIEVVKGPSAATLYGQDAANGVIVITTKRGRPGPARWTSSYERGTTTMPGGYPLLYMGWGHMPSTSLRVACPRDGNGSNGPLRGPCVQDSVSTYQMLSDPDLTILDRGERRAATLGVSGGTQSLSYSITGSVMDEVGLVQLPQYEAQRYANVMGMQAPDWMQRPQSFSGWSASSRVVAAVGKAATVSLQSSLSHTKQQRSSLEGQISTLMGTYLDRGTGTYYRADAISGDWAIFESNNVLQSYYERATAKSTQFQNSAGLNWAPYSWASVSADVGLNVIQRDDEIYLPHEQLVLQDSAGRLDRGQGTSLVKTLNTSARAQRRLGRGFTFMFGMGANYAGTSIGDLMGGVERLAFGTSSINRGGRIGNLREDRLEQATFGYYIEPAINHRRSWLSAGLRYDGSTSFGSGFRIPRFPKLSYSHLLSDEPWFPFKDLFQVLRLRVAYGQAGRQPDPTSRLRLYTAATPEFVEGDYRNAVELQTLGNTQLKPERTKEFENGFDADMFNDRLTLGFSSWQKRTFDMLLNVPLPPSVYGNGVSYTRNIGEVVGAGYDIMLGAQPLRTDRWGWSVSGSFSRQRDRVVALGKGVEPFYTDVYVANNAPNGGLRVAAGYPLFGRWVRPILGYADANGNGLLERDEVLIGDTAVYVGRTMPDFTASAFSTITLFRSALVLTTAMSYQHGMNQRNDVAKRLGGFSRARNDSTSSIADQAAAMPWSDYPWIQTVSMLRLESVTVTYNASQSIARHFGTRALSLSLQGSNLGLHTNYRGLDPNVNAFGTGNNVIDTGVLPRPRTYQLRLNATY